MTKLYGFIILIVMTTLLLSGCKTEEKMIRGRVVENNETELLVMRENNGSLIRVSITSDIILLDLNDNEIDVSDIEVDADVYVEFNGEIEDGEQAELAQIKHAYQISLYEKK